MLRALILADDLSGAADTGVAFAGAGLNVIVSLGGVFTDTNVDVLSVNADTRQLQGTDAADLVRRLMFRFAANQKLNERLLLFKKIDSTLRGHVGVELAAALAAYRELHPGPHRPVAICAPAFPAIGRTTINGTQWLHGNPLHQTEIWRLHGMSHAAYIPGILQAAGLHVVLFSLDVIRSADDELVQAMQRAAPEADVLVCDAESDQDLSAIASASIKLECKTLLAGSAGLAHQLPRAAGLNTVPRVRGVFPPVEGPLLFVIGSLSRRSTEQLERLTSSSQTLHLAVPPDILLAGEDSMAWRGYERQLRQAIERHSDVVVGPGSELQIEIADRPRLTASLARMAVSVSHKVGALVAAGGETACSVLHRWGVSGLRLLGEVETGVPVAVTEGWSRQLPVVTKAGDFGKPETLLSCARYLRGREV